jgi:hypothetical protein
MDRLDYYRQCIRNFLNRYSQLWLESSIENQVILDSELECCALVGEKIESKCF